MSHNKQLKVGALLSYLSIAVNIAAGLIYTPWMVRMIGKGDYGLYTLANSLITLFLVDFGLSSATARYLSKYRAEGRQDKIDNFLGVIYKLYLLIDAVILTVLIVVFFLIDRIYIKLTPLELEKFKVVYLIAASFAVVNFPFVTFNGILNSYEKFIPLKLSDLIYRVLLVSMTVAALLLGQGLYALVAIHAVVGLILIVYKLAVIRKTIPLKINWSYSEKGLYRDIFGFSIWVTVASLAQRLIFNITPSVLGITVGSGAIAVFGIVATIEGYTFTITTAINGMFMPKISRIYESKQEKNALMPLLLGVGKFQYCINGLIFAGFAVVGKRFIRLWMDSSYLDAYYGILLVVLPGLFFNALQIANTAMVVQNKVKLQAGINVAMGLVNILLAPILSHYIGVIGACASIFIAYILRVVLLIWVNKRVMGFDMKLFIRKCYIASSPPIIVTIAVGLLLNQFWKDGGWLTLGVKALFVTLIYGITALLFVLNKEEKALLLRPFRRFKPH